VASDKYKEQHDKSAKEHNFQVGDEVLIDNQLFVSKNKKFSPMWIGPFVITKIINKQNVEVKIKNRAQIYNVCRLKKFINPENSKFKDENCIKKHTVEHSDTDTENGSENAKLGSEVPIKNQTANELIKNSIERRVTRSMKKLISKEAVSINAINSLIIPETDRYKLTAIAIKLHQSIALTQSEKDYWKNFSKEEKSYIITGDSQLTLDFTQYQEGYYSSEYWKLVQPKIIQPPAPPIEEDEALEPDLGGDNAHFSESEDEDHPVLRRAGTKDSGFNPVSEDSRSQESARTNPPEGVSTPKQGTSTQTDNSQSSPEEFSTPPQTLAKPRGRPKGSKNIKRVYFDAEAIGLRTRAKLHKGEYDEDGDYLMPILNEAVIFSCNINNNNREHDGIGLDTFINECQLRTCEYSGRCKSQQSGNTNSRGTTSNGENSANLDYRGNNSLFNNRHHTGHFAGD
jgi:hypothetical protein